MSPKRDIFQHLLDRGDSVLVRVDGRRDGVVLPAALRRQHDVLLVYGRDLPVPIPDLDAGDRGLAATLSFNRAPEVTFVPWSAVYAIVSAASGMGSAWPDDAPPEVLAAAAEAPPQEERSPPPDNVVRLADYRGRKGKRAPN